ncbi:MAG: linear amide C-N hydrolase, partial [Pyrinomonadaceae bacterium]
MKTKRFAVLPAILIVFCLSATRVFACTTFCLKNKGEILFGKNYDWMVGDGLVFVNKRGVSKSASLEGTNPARWVSEYGSVTFNQYGRENPSGGLNEAGLVIELMWLDETQYPAEDSRPALDVLEWIQYQLDTSATVADVIENSEKVRISSLVRLHYLVNDKAGNSATIEFLNGKMVTHHGEALPFSTLTNDTYEKSLKYSKTTALERAHGNGSLERFARAAKKSGEFGKSERAEAEAVNYAFEILRDVAQARYTQWSIVYDQKRHKIHFRTLQAPQIKTIDAKAFDYSCGSTVKILDMNAKTAGDVTAKFTDYTRKVNRELIERSFNGTDFLRYLPSVVRDQLASYPEEFVCAAAQSKPTTQTKLTTSAAASAWWPTAF